MFYAENRKLSVSVFLMMPFEMIDFSPPNHK